jgi:hypothetical protein
MAEFIFEVVCYFTGRLLLPVLSLGRIKVAPLSEPIRRARVVPTRSTGDIIVGDSWTTFAGFLIWVAVIVLGILLHRFGSL